LFICSDYGILLLSGRIREQNKIMAVANFQSLRIGPQSLMVICPHDSVHFCDHKYK
jgi:hypothetical protein